MGLRSLLSLLPSEVESFTMTTAASPLDLSAEALLAVRRSAYEAVSLPPNVVDILSDLRECVLAHRLRPAGVRVLSSGTSAAALPRAAVGPRPQVRSGKVRATHLHLGPSNV